MVAYWLMFALPALAALSPWRGTLGLQRTAWFLLGVLFTLIIGFRYQVGADWEPYLTMYANALDVPLSEAIEISDPAYALLNWLSGQVGGEIFLVNLVCGAIVMAGVIGFCRRQPLPWLAMLVAVPFMIIVVAMGVTRQSAALGFLLLALVALQDGHVRRFVVLVVIGALFHMTALVLLPLAMVVASRNRVWTMLWVGLTGLGLGAAILVEHLDRFWMLYVEGQMMSEGAQIRIAMNALPAVLLLIFRKKLAPEENERRVWVWMAIVALACIPLVGFASTAVDRIALYFMPIQLYVFSRVHRLFPDRPLKTVAVASVILVYGLVQWVWLNHAVHATSWLPYQFYPMVWAL